MERVVRFMGVLAEATPYGDVPCVEVRPRGVLWHPCPY